MCTHISAFADVACGFHVEYLASELRASVRTCTMRSTIECFCSPKCRCESQISQQGTNRDSARNRLKPSLQASQGALVVALQGVIWGEDVGKGAFAEELR